MKIARRQNPPPFEVGAVEAASPARIGTGARAGPEGAAVIGAGPAGLMAAEAARKAGCEVDVHDAMPSAGRKFLLAGKGGLNLTHAEPFEHFVEIGVR